mgnify:CR=1 FL=1
MGCPSLGCVEIGIFSHTGAAVSRYGGSSLSVVLAGGPYRWISEALSTLRYLTQPHRRRIDVAGGRVENGEAFSTRYFQATSLPGYFALGQTRENDSPCKAKPVGGTEESDAGDAERRAGTRK